MTEQMYLLFLVPYAVILIWVTAKLRFNLASTIVLCISTMVIVWFVVYAAVNFAVPDPSFAFASVEEIMKENSYEWYFRYFFTNFGALFGLVYYWICWGVAWLFFS